MNLSTINIFIGYDTRERVAANILQDSLLVNSSLPISITNLITSQLENKKLYYRKRETKQSTDFSFTRFLVPYLMNYQGWAIFMDCDMLCRADISKLWEQRDEAYSVMCVKHNHIPNESKKFLNEIQSSYEKKNWSSLMMFNCKKCKKLDLNYVNQQSGLNLHRFKWLENDNEIGEISGGWNHLVDVESNEKAEESPLLHWTLGGPWFESQSTMGGKLAALWFKARYQAMKFYDY